MENIRVEFVNKILDYLEDLYSLTTTEQEQKLMLQLLCSLHEHIEPADLELKKEWNELKIGVDF